MTSCAVITRTKSRPLLLQRAMLSVSAQTFRDFIWVIVNDGGEPEPVDQIAAQASARGVNVKVLHRPGSQGMEAASNAGIRACESEHIAIHDDDDSWSPQFLQRTSDYLHNSQHLAGVCTQSLRITEEIVDGAVRRLRQEPHKPVLTSVQLADILVANLFPPIALLYRRDIFQKLGGYDESMAILGDWDFNIRALLVADIGVIPEVLANYHVRPATNAGSRDYVNSITAGSTSQHMADAQYRNRWLRNDIAEGKAGLGFLLAIGRMERQTAKMAGLKASLARLFSWPGTSRSSHER